MKIRRQLRILQAYAALSLCALAFLSVSAFTQATSSQRIDELTVQRLNVVDASGTLRMVISNKDRMHPGAIDGMTLKRPRPEAGLIFFNDLGDEVGGLSYRGTNADGRRVASGQLAFDQFKQDQIVAMTYQESEGARKAGLQVWDRPEQSLGEVIRGVSKAEPSATRVFVGRNPDKSATVSLADAKGKPRLVMKVAPDGAASIEFLDANGKMVQRIPDAAR
jgi:hypothetical protein